MKTNLNFKLFHSMAMLIAISMLTTQVGFGQEDKPDTKKEKVDIEALLEEAQSAVESKDYDEAAKLFKKVCDADDKNGVACHMLGYALHLGGKVDEAIEVHKKAAKFDEFKAISLYNLGCAYSLKKKNKESIKALHQALDAKFDRLEMFKTDSDLANVRKSKGWKAIAARVKNGGLRPKFNVKKMVGSWQVTKGVRAGNKVDNERLPVITVDAKAFTIPAGADKFVMEYKVDNNKRPAQIDMTITAGPAPEGSKAIGLIKKQGNKLMLCYDPTGAKRPKKFEATEENGCHLFVMELEKDDDDDGEEEEGGDDDEEDDDHDHAEKKDKDGDHDDDN